MTAPIPDTARIDFAALTDQLRILPTSRSWGAVQDSLRMLQPRSREERMQPEMQDHVKNVDVFAGTIRDHADVIAQAFACGVTLARLAQGANPASNVQGALQTLSRAYNFSDLSTEKVKERLGVVWTALRQYAGGVSPTVGTPGSTSVESAPQSAALSQEKMPPVSGKADVAPWFAWLDKVLQTARETTPATPALLTSIQLAAWSSVLARYASELRSATPPPNPDVSETVCDQALVAPSSVLGFSVRDTPAVAWARFVVPDRTLRSLETGATPWWARGLCAHALGFRSPDRVKMLTMFSFLESLPWGDGPAGQVANPQEHEEFLERSTLFLQPGLPQTLFVVRREADSLVARWPTCPTAAVLPMTVGQTTVLLSAGQQQGMSALALRATGPRAELTVAVENPVDRQSLAVANQLFNSIRDLVGNTRSGPAGVQRVLFGPGAAETAGSSGDLVVPSPRRYEDLLPSSSMKSAS